MTDVAFAFACPACGRPVETTLAPDVSSCACAGCGATTTLPEAAEARSTGPVVCPLCGCREIYGQKDFSRPLGLALAFAGLLAGPFTAWISTVVAVAADAVLYLVMPWVAVCYACEAQQRGFEPGRRPPAFDIAIHDAYKFGKRFPPRRERAGAGPNARRVEFDARRRAIQG